MRGVGDVWTLQMDLDSAKRSSPGLVLSCFTQVDHSLALVPLKSASRASISSSDPSAFSITLRPPDLLEGTNEVSFPRLWVLGETTHSFGTEISLEAGRDFQTGPGAGGAKTNTNRQMRRKYSGCREQALTRLGGVSTFSRLEGGQHRFFKAGPPAFKNV